MEVSARIATLELAETFVISRESADTADVVQVEIRHEGVSGYGEGAPIERYNESAESALAYIEDHADVLGDDPFALDEIEQRLEPREWAARAANSSRGRRSSIASSANGSSPSASAVSSRYAFADSADSP